MATTSEMVNILLEAWQHTADKKIYSDLVLSHNNVVVRLLYDSVEAMDVFETICDEVDVSVCMTHFVDMRHLFLHPTVSAAGHTLLQAWQQVDDVVSSADTTAPAKTLLKDMSVVTLNRLERASQLECNFYAAHRLRTPMKPLLLRGT